MDQNIQTNYKTPDQTKSDREILAKQNARVEQNRAIRDRAQHTETTIEKIKRAASSTAKTAGEAINKVVNDPNVRKAGRVVQGRVDAFNTNITSDVAPTRKRSPQQQTQYQPKHQPKYQPHSVPRQAAQDNPFNLGGGDRMNIGGAGTPGSGDPFGVSGIKKKGGGNNPFGLR